MDTENNYFGNFVLLKMVWFPKQRSKVHQKLYVIYFHYYGLLLLQILIHQWGINIQHSMLYHPVFPQYCNSLIRMSRIRKKYPTFYVILPLGNHWFNVKEVTRDIADNDVITFFIFKCFGSWNKEGKYSTNYMLAFTLLWVVTSADSY